MGADILILGQGLAGTLLGWELEQAGISFEIADAGHAGAASQVAAGIINPITGRRLVKSWRIEELRPKALRTYQAMEAAWGVPLWTEMRVRRLFQDERERRILAEKTLTGELAPYATEGEAEGFWIEQAARVDLPRLLATARARWLVKGWLREDRVALAEARSRYALVIDCTGQALASAGPFSFVPWEHTKGQVIAITVEGLAADVILNRGQWILPTGAHSALVGATHETHFETLAPTADARDGLVASAESILGRTVTVTGQQAGLRVHLPDKHPVTGRHPGDERLGLINGLGAKGALTAPWLARQWVHHLCEGIAFDRDVAVTRFVGQGIVPVSEKN